MNREVFITVANYSMNMEVLLAMCVCVCAWVCMGVGELLHTYCPVVCDRDFVTSRSAIECRTCLTDTIGSWKNQR